jgi:uncharacterized protein (TIGR03435 family)
MSGHIDQSAVPRRKHRFAPCLIAWIATAALAQAPAVSVFHPQGPPLTYDVATIKPANPDQPYSGTTLRRYIAQAYGVPIPWGAPPTLFSGAQVAGGPAWIDSDKYDIKGKPSDDLRQAMQKMSADQSRATTRTMQQALLAERFHLKVHFETHEMPLFEMVPAKGGLKIKPLTGIEEEANQSMNMSIRGDGATILTGKAATMDLLLNALRGESPDIAGRPIVDRTGFQGRFDLQDFRFSGMPLPNAGNASVSVASEPDVPSLSQALEQLGLKLVPAKGQVEVVVIDSIDRPTEN